ncbi:hypothetical protein, partial [Lactobacillus crispatus]|nr:hypothetical protein [Lactobacillus crispatus]
RSMKMKDENGRDIKLGLEEARHIMATDYCVRSDLALCGEFFNEYGMLPQEYIKEYGNESN